MAREDVDVDPAVDLSSLREALAAYGCELSLVEGTPVAMARTVRIEFPEDEYLEKVCRDLVRGWRPEPPALEPHQ